MMIQSIGDKMNRIEIIHIRINSARSVNVVKNLLKQALKTNSNEMAHLTKIYHHQRIENDLCVMLNWNAAEMAGTWRDPGQPLTVALKEFGHVDHSVWVEI